MYAKHARDFYFELLLTTHLCPACGEKMRVMAPGQWRCRCSVALDPTIEFQRSVCCDARLRRKRCHYACTRCGTQVASKFLFQERLFDGQYFCEKMSESRQRKRRRREAMQRLLAASRSLDVAITECPTDSDLISFSQVLDAFVGHDQMVDADAFLGRDCFQMEAYRSMVLASLEGRTVRFDTLPSVCPDQRLDRIRRFITLLFMEQAHEVWLEQRDHGILVMPYETHIEG